MRVCGARQAGGACGSDGRMRPVLPAGQLVKRHPAHVGMSEAEDLGDVGHRVLKGDQVAIEAHETRVWTGRDPEDPSRIKAVPIPDEVVAALRG